MGGLGLPFFRHTTSLTIFGLSGSTHMSLKRGPGRPGGHQLRDMTALGKPGTIHLPSMAALGLSIRTHLPSTGPPGTPGSTYVRGMLSFFIQWRGMLRVYACSRGTRRDSETGYW